MAVVRIKITYWLMKTFFQPTVFLLCAYKNSITWEQPSKDTGTSPHFCIQGPMTQTPGWTASLLSRQSGGKVSFKLVPSLTGEGKEPVWDSHSLHHAFHLFLLSTPKPNTQKPPHCQKNCNYNPFPSIHIMVVLVQTFNLDLQSPALVFALMWLRYKFIPENTL